MSAMSAYGHRCAYTGPYVRIHRGICLHMGICVHTQDRMYAYIGAYLPMGIGVHTRDLMYAYIGAYVCLWAYVCIHGVMRVHTLHNAACSRKPPRT